MKLRLRASGVCMMLVGAALLVCGCNLPGKLTAEDVALARLGVETAIQSAASTGETLSKREDRPLSVIIPIFPSLVNHKFGAFNDVMQDRRIDVHVHVDTDEKSTR